MARPEPEPAGDLAGWDVAPCGLLEVDRHGQVIRANGRFLSRAGYTRTDVERGLRWPDLLAPASRLFFETQLAPMIALDGTVEEVMLELIRSDGERVPILVNVDADPELRGALRIAFMSVPDRFAYEQQLRDARDRAEEARQASARGRRRLELLARAGAALVASLDVEAAVSGLTRVLVDGLADWCLVYLVDPDLPNEAPRWCADHRDPLRRPDVDRLAAALLEPGAEQSVMARVLVGAEPVLMETVTDEHLQSAAGAEARELAGRLGTSSSIVVPSRARGQQVAAIILVRGDDQPRFTADDLDDVTDIAARAGLAIDNVRRYAREHGHSVALQRALLTDPPKQGRLQIATSYVPGVNGSEVGGDWYDAFHQPDGSMVVVIGDVVGHDIEAAASMGQLRGVLRTIAHTTGASPARILARADRTAAGLQVDVVASAVVARIIESEDGSCTLQWSNAGHPPPLLVRNGSVEVLERRSDPMLGVVPERRRTDYEIGLEPGDTLLLYTDGLVERRDEDLDQSVVQLARGLDALPRVTPEELCEAALRHRPPDSDDDVALLVVRVNELPG